MSPAQAAKRCARTKQWICQRLLPQDGERWAAKDRMSET